ncbi:potassium channel family protein [Microbacterium sediminicola]|uniref:Potassium channel family protein n=1 Tax=Microbacterium sediminicola TaxID=415210 RepID=A0ABN2IC59_9MICO
MNEERWEKLTYWPLVVASAAFIIAYSWQVIADLRGPLSALMGSVMGITWIIFAADYVICLLIARHKLTWFRTHIFDLLVVLLPFLRPLRLLKALTVVQTRVSKGQALRTRVIWYAGGTVAVLVWVCSLAVLAAERGAPGANIQDFSESLWWSFVTITTVGYGDYYPVTGMGRLVAIFLMAGGIGIVGVVTATTASWIVEKAAAGDDDAETATRGQIRSLAAQISDIVQNLPQPTQGGAETGAGSNAPAAAADVGAGESAKQ